MCVVEWIDAEYTRSKTLDTKITKRLKLLANTAGNGRADANYQLRLLRSSWVFAYPTSRPMARVSRLSCIGESKS
jgi:hypothetical protein